MGYRTGTSKERESRGIDLHLTAAKHQGSIGRRGSWGLPFARHLDLVDESLGEVSAKHYKISDSKPRGVFHKHLARLVRQILDQWRGENLSPFVPPIHGMRRLHRQNGLFAHLPCIIEKKRPVRARPSQNNI